MTALRFIVRFCEQKQNNKKTPATNHQHPKSKQKPTKQTESKSKTTGPKWWTMPERHVQFYEFKWPDCVGDQCVLHQCACIASRLGEKKSHDSTCTAVVTESIYSAYCCVRCLLNAYNLQNQSVCTPFLSTRQLACPHNLTHSLYTVEWSSLISSLSFREAYNFLTEGKLTTFLQRPSFPSSKKPTTFFYRVWAAQVLGSLQLFILFL